jgi:hypothetical protein
MNTDNRSEYVTRDTILKLLSDGEMAKLSLAETATGLADGDEYIDLEQLSQGVRHAGGQTRSLPVQRLLPRKAVLDATWKKILSHLSTPALAPDLSTVH